MPAPVRVDLATAQDFASQACGWTPADGELADIPRGFANHNWRVPTADGDVLLKIGPAASADKWVAAQLGVDRAHAAGLLAPAVRTTTVIGDHVVRTLDWVDGASARTLVDDHRAQAELGAQLGAAIAALHTDELEGFGSRLDGSSPKFPTWAGYVQDRLGAIGQRADAGGAPASGLRQRAAVVVEELALAVSEDCRPVVCHRDLHPDNLIVGPGGSLNGIIDWDMAEGWDAAGEWFKLEGFLFEHLPHMRSAFEAAYVAVAPPVHDKRRRLVLVMESLNVVANAAVQDSGFTQWGVEQLRRLL